MSEAGKRADHAAPLARLPRLALAYVLASYVVAAGGAVVTTSFHFPSGWRGAGEVAALVFMLVFAPISVFAFMILYGLPILVLRIFTDPYELFESPGVLLPYAVLVVAWALAYCATPFLVRWYRARRGLTPR